MNFEGFESGFFHRIAQWWRNSSNIFELLFRTIGKIDEIVNKAG
jgi:hypothetical protein